MQKSTVSETHTVNTVIYIAFNFYNFASIHHHNGVENESKEDYD